MDAKSNDITGSLRDRLSDLRMRRRGENRSTVPVAAPDVQSPALPGTATRINNSGGKCWYWKTLATQVCQGVGVDPDALHRARSWQSIDQRLCDTQPGDAFVFDLETGGLSSSTPVFLIGAIALNEWPLCVHQWLAADYPEERAVVQAFVEWIDMRRTWISFNGKSFDEPFVRDRGVILRIPVPPVAAHLDLLHLSRRRWKGELPNCRLQTLEKHILGRERHGDVPSADVPDLFHYACRTGNLRPLSGVLLHNQIDLISCVELYLHLTEAA
jgi:uncharacterized protein YprB with RNaseH-like and TPR domain